MLDGRRDRWSTAGCTRGERNREAIIDALIACYDDGDAAAERARGRGAGRRVGALGAQPLRRRRGAARRGRAAAVGAVRAVRGPRSIATLPVAERVDAARRAARRVLRRGHARAPRRAAVGRTSRRRSPRTSPGSTARCGASSSARFPTSTADALDARRRASRRGTRGTGCGAAQGCSVARARRVLTRTISHTHRRSRVMSAIRPNKEQFIELMEAPDEGPVVMLNLLKFKEQAEGDEGSRRERVRQVRRRGRADGRGAGRQGAVDGPGRPDADRRPRPRTGTRSCSCSTRAARRSSRWCRRRSTKQAHEHRESGLERTVLIACTERVSRLLGS